MADRAEQQSTTSLPWWVHTCRAGWKIVRFFWAIFILTLVLPKAVDVLFSDKPLQSLPNLWPILEAIVHHPVWTLLTFLGLLLLTGLFWFGSRERTTTPQHVLFEHDRIYMLRRLRLRYEQMLAQSLQGADQIELGFATRSAAVQNAASLSFRLPDQPEQPLPPHTSIRQVYELAQQELLILGEPGAGKSTLLLELAHHLIERAEQDTTQPLPVLLPLSSWATNRHPVHEWLVEQCHLLYDVPGSLSQQWFQTNQLLPLLDGLDEMEASACAACVAAINIYHRAGLQPLVVCSRTNEYEAAATRERLALHAAVVVQPLSRQQVDTHLTSMGKPLAALRAALRKNTVLRELATTPLMLQVLMLTYHGTSVRELPHKEAQLREQIWTDYVQRMVSRRGDVKRYPLQVTITWLGWLARQMRQRNQAFFYLQQLQPDWLPKRRRTYYQWSIGLFYGLFYGLLSGLAIGLFGELLHGLAIGLATGLLGGLFIGVSPKLGPGEALIWSLNRSWKGLGIWVGIWVVFLLLSGLFYGLAIGLVGGLAIGLVLGLVLVWLLNRSWKGRGIQLAFWVGIWVVFLLVYGLVGGPFGLLLYGMTFGLFIGGHAGPIQHTSVKRYILRFWLWRTHLFPWQAVSFLDDATTRTLLEKVGPAYYFIHRLLLDYFADLDTQASPTSTDRSST